MLEPPPSKTTYNSVTPRKNSGAMFCGVIMVYPEVKFQNTPTNVRQHVFKQQWSTVWYSGVT